MNHDTRFAVVFGTRPEMIKLAPLIGLLGDRARVVHTGQHFDDTLSARILEDLSISDPVVNLGAGGMSRAEQIGSVLTGLGAALSGVDGVIVQGDTNSTVAGGIAANAMDLPLFHVEAGLRSFDRRMPEEHNRVIVDHLADKCWAPTDVNTSNLTAEGIPGTRIVQTGNSIVEALQATMPPAADVDRTLRRFGLESRSFALVTLHRPENVDDPDRLSSILDCLGALPVPVLFPMHPRTGSVVANAGLEAKLERLAVVEPVGYQVFLSLLSAAAVVVSDSGGVQEEVSILKVPLVVLRRSTERPEVLGTFASLTEDPDEMLTMARSVLELGEDLFDKLAEIPTPYGDGHASQRMLESLNELG